MEKGPKIFPSIRSDNLLDLYIPTNLKALGLAIAREKAFQTFFTPLDEASPEVIPIPALKFTAMIRLPARDLLEYVRAGQTTSTNGRLELDSEAFTISTKEMRWSTVTEFKVAKSDDVKFDGKGRATYNFNYLEPIVNTLSKTKWSQELILEFGIDMPLRISVEIPDAHLCYYIAPRIDDETKKMEIVEERSKYTDERKTSVGAGA